MYYSFAVGTLGLSLTALFAAALMTRRELPAPVERQSLHRLVLTMLGVHLIHLLEETTTEFYVAFPRLLNLEPWSITLFLGFNLALLAFWLGCLLSNSKLPLALTAYCFLALASALNGVVHPLLALSVQGYFPGLWSSPLVGLYGVLLLRRLLRLRQLA